MSRRLAAFGIAAVVLAAATSVGASFDGVPGKIVFSGRGDKNGLFLARRDGSHVTRLTRAQDGSPIWSPQGDKIAFLRWSTNGVGSLQVIGRDGSGRIRLTEAPAADCGFQVPHWSYDGLFIAYAHDCFDRAPRVAELRVTTADGTSEVAATDQTSLNGFGRQPWSPSLEDGSRLTFVSDRDGDHDVYTVNSDGTGVRQLTSEEGFAIEPAWSPDGSVIAYTVQHPTQPRSDLWAISPEGGVPFLLVEGTPHAGAALWSPDGTRLLFTRATRQGRFSLMAAQADGSNEVEIGNGLHGVMATWSPGSSAVLVNESGALVRYRLGPPLTRKVLVTNVPEFGGADWQAR